MSRPRSTSSLTSPTWIDNSSALNAFLSKHEQSTWVAFDTEFVSESTYRPELCLIQVKVDDDVALIDPFATDITSFWKWLSSPDRKVLVHACREELRFIHLHADQVPLPLYDVHLIAGRVGLEYPAAYSTLTNRLLAVTLDKGETRTDWSRRPLSEQQINYAAADVEYLMPIYEALNRRVAELNRNDWIQTELISQQEAIIETETTPQWRRVSGSGSLNSRELAILRELWLWRDQVARELNRPAKRVLRDDLMCELSKRKTADQRRVKSIRGMEHRQLQRHLPDILETIRIALEIDEDQWPRRIRSSRIPQRSTLAQFLFTAIGTYCQKQSMAPNLVTTMQTIREFLAWRLDGNKKTRQTPITDGWRAELLGSLREDVLEGKLVAHVSNPTSDQPLTFVPHSAINSDQDES
ncbi:MAG: HRDC domain-containing protein [Pirellulales bacterium]|nr:HRDC domain-containing protein [Pirellulales bacterium]